MCLLMCLQSAGMRMAHLIFFFNRMPERTMMSWTAGIDGLALHGRDEEAISVCEAMRNSGIKPDDVAFISGLNAYSHTGLVNEGSRYFNSVRHTKLEHCGCMVDLLARGGLVQEAMEFVKSMPTELNPIIWRTHIGACKVHGKLQFGEKNTKDLIYKELMHSSHYVLLSNVYALMQHRGDGD